MLLVYKCLHGDLSYSPDDLGLSLVTSCARGSGIRQRRQPLRGNICASLFCHRTAATWNKLPVSVLTCTSLRALKLKIYNRLDLFDIQRSKVDAQTFNLFRLLICFVIIDCF